MADRSIMVRLRADIADFKGKFEQAGKAASGLADAVEKNTASLSTLGSASTKAGLLVAAGLAFAIKSAIDWESAWAGVIKTVDGSSTQLNKLEGDLRSMARELPASHTEIAAVAEAAGQLGVKVDDVAEFTRVMIDLGETTNVSAEEAASSLAKFMNIMGTSMSQVSNLGSVIVALGNNFATTERDIIAMATRIAAAGKAAGMTEADVFGLAAALSSVGIEAEAGGTAISMAMVKIGNSVEAGGAKLDMIAEIAGVSAKQFKAAWEGDAAGALAMFTAGLGKMQKQGESARGALADLGMRGIREADAMMRLALAGDVLTDSLSMSAEAMKANTALAVEAQMRYDTTASKIKIAWNNIKDAAIEFGAVALPVVANMADAVVKLASAFGSMPGPVKSATVGISALAAGGLLAFGGFTKLLTTAVELRSAVKTLATAFPGLAKAIGGVDWKKHAVAAGLFGAALIGVGLAAQAGARRAEEMMVSAEDLAVAMGRAKDPTVEMNKAFQFSEGAISAFRNNIDGVGDALERALNPSKMQAFGDFMNSLVGGASTADQLKKQFAELDQVLAGLAAGGNAQQAAQNFEAIAAAAQAQGIPVERLVELFPEYSTYLRESANATGAAVTGAEALAASTGAVKTAAEEAAEAERYYTEAILTQANALLGLSGSLIGYKQSVADATEAIKKNGATLDINTKKGRENQTALDRIASSGLAVQKSMQEAGKSTDEVSKHMAGVRKDFVKAAEAAGMSSKAANRLADDYGLIPATVVTKIDTPGVKVSQKEADELNKKLRGLPSEVKSKIVTIANLEGVEAAKRALASVQSKTVRVTTLHTNRAVADGGMFERSGWGLNQSFADGGFARIGSQQPQVRPAGGRGITWAEDGAGPWEAFISGHPAKRLRSRWILEDVARRLGGAVAWQFADGGMYRPQRTEYAQRPATSGAVSNVTNLTLNVDLDRALDVMQLVNAANSLGRDVRSMIPGV